MDEFVRSIIWRRLDNPGHEWAQGSTNEDGVQFYGTAIFVDQGKRSCLDYLIDCDENGETVGVEVIGEAGDETIEIEISVDDDGTWTMNGERQPQVGDCIDIDLNFSPLTNTLPIRRLDLAVGESEHVIAAWLRFPSFKLERFEQTYTRVDDNLYRYESRDGSFSRDLTVDEHGFVTDYPGFWTEERAEG
jgi:hypothetical protein